MKCSVFDASLPAKKVEENISAMRRKLEETAILLPSVEDTGLQSLSGTMATPVQAQDLLSFWEVGLQHFQARVKYYVLQEPSASVPQRLNRLLTFASTIKMNRKVKAIELERKVVNRCVRRTMAWNARLDLCNSVEDNSTSSYIEQSVIQMAIHTRGRKPNG